MQPSVKSANRALDVFELLALETNGLTISEVSDRLGIARSSTHALVHTLLTRGYLTIDGGNRFYLGVRLIQLGLTVADRLELRSAAHGFLEQLVTSTRDTALLVVPDRGELLYVDRVMSDTRGVRTDPRMSMGSPLHCSSLGKALLAALGDAWLLDIVGSSELAGATEFSLTDVEDLRADLADTRQRGYSIDRQEAVVGVWCVGAPVRDHTGRSVAAISVSTIKEFFDPSTSGPLVTAAAVDISRAMGWNGDASVLYHYVSGSEQLLLPSPELAEVGG